MPLTENRATELITQYLSDHPHINVLSDQGWPDLNQAI